MELCNAMLLGNPLFQNRFNCRYAYVSGSMFKGISSKELVLRMRNAGFMAFLGIGGLSDIDTEKLLGTVELSNAKAGVNFLHCPQDVNDEWRIAECLLKYNIQFVEASAFMKITPALVWYRIKGIKLNKSGAPICQNTILAKLSRPELAEAFFAPPPQKIISNLLELGKINSQEAELSQLVPMADTVCIEADSAGHTDRGVMSVLFPAMRKIKDISQKLYNYNDQLLLGAAGGIGTPEAAAAAFIQGADFILTGSVNQCTIEANTSEAVKNYLQSVNIHDMDYSPAGDMFEYGAKVQVASKGFLFPGRANRLYELYRYNNSWADIDTRTKENIEKNYFKKSYLDVWKETEDYYSNYKPIVLTMAEKSEKFKLALIFKWYFIYSIRIALNGDLTDFQNAQIHCGPALGAFNQSVKGSKLTNWKSRHVDDVATFIMEGAANILKEYFIMSKKMNPSFYDDQSVSQ